MLNVIGLERAIAEGNSAAEIRSIEAWHIARAVEVNEVRRGRHRRIAKDLRGLAARLEEVEAKP